MLRITAGVFRGRSIQTPHHQSTRPTQAKLRQALFNSVQTRIPDARVLDLFAGSGALGFEALSRGASSVVLVEQSKPTAKLIYKNVESLDVKDRVQVLIQSVETSEKQLKPLFPFDVILADPPYAEGWEMKLLMEWPWEASLAPGGIFCLEWGLKKSVISELPDRVPFLVKVREKNYGDSVLTTYQRGEEG
jgi:16S rRNA (guanine(966)-N(2))-methyltransferase RsmD